jgi:hypothetical protein
MCYVVLFPHHGLGAQAAHAGVHETNAEEQRQPQRRPQLCWRLQRHRRSRSRSNQPLQQARRCGKASPRTWSQYTKQQ